MSSIDDEVRTIIVDVVEAHGAVSEAPPSPPVLSLFTSEAEPQAVVEFLLESVHRISSLVAPLVFDVDGAGLSALVTRPQGPQSPLLSPTTARSSSDADEENRLRANTVFRGVQFMSCIRALFQDLIVYHQKYGIKDAAASALSRSALRSMNSDVFVGPIVHLLQAVPATVDWFAAVFATLQFVKVR